MEVVGEVARPRLYSIEALRSAPQVEQTVDIHCVTRWSKLSATFSGPSLAWLLQAAEPRENARFVSFVARSERGHSTSLPLDDALRAPCLIALDYAGQPLETEHGGPCRVVTPGRYFYKSLKWLERIELLADDRLGYWEATAGYHNAADPWLEQRYMAPSLTLREARAALASRDFSGRDLRSLDARGHQLDGLSARGALLRDADFRGCSLRQACFEEANLSNAHLQGADLRGASLLRADLEGADFSSADLRGADFRQASLFGATFFDPADPLSSAAKVDGSTRFSPRQFDALTPEQFAFLTGVWQGGDSVD